MLGKGRGFVPAWFMEGMILLTIVGIVLAVVIPGFPAANAAWIAWATRS